MKYWIATFFGFNWKLILIILAVYWIGLIFYMGFHFLKRGRTKKRDASLYKSSSNDYKND